MQKEIKERDTHKENYSRFMSQNEISTVLQDHDRPKGNDFYEGFIRMNKQTKDLYKFNQY